ncbi:MAG: sugar ABC transporter ATP-binding protein [Sphaerochaeta sp.]|jgi:putative multiple sugar transport system ATP-binding protein|nr:sugar ABC transporter ATP-binding protein [Sphaerochaeta sp.]MCH3920596.1 sugar ABC transporter ATP-binding protein [Sphaerochaeta sp.]MCI2045894.1 sugar ABC transporter ATP-binding protein [Sphaerochaeta sp.]MCI2128961.1 sugar ABC transporter ATP-binding protein [Sphaerochaeta sp.]
MDDIILEMKHITKTFPGVRALDDVSLSVRRGEIHAICGENGAGKSTLMKVLSGVYPFGSYEGEIIYDGKPCAFQSIRDSEKTGIVIIHQELALVPMLSIGENMFLGNEQGTKFNIDWNETYGKADQYLKLVGLHENSHTLIKDLGVGKQQLVEIAKALAKDVKLLILDEPTASLNEEDSKHLLDLLLGFKKKGMTSIIISHKINEIAYCADSVTIMRDGAVIREMTKEEGFDEKTIVNAMVGRDLAHRFPQRVPNIGPVVFEVKDWTVYHPTYHDKKVCNDISITLRKGEILGISGLMGAGRTEFAMSLFGHSYGTNITGHTYINGKEVVMKSPKEAIEHKLSYVTEDRKGNGLILPEPITTNTTLSSLYKIVKKGRKITIDRDMEVNEAKKYIKEMGTKCSSHEQIVSNLSGGNQQKVLLGKWLFAEPDILFLDEPTRGIDVGAKYEIYCLMNSIVEKGKSIIMISSEMPELLGMCDRIYVMSEGRIAGELTHEEATQEKILTMILNSEKGRVNLDGRKD